LFENVLGLLVKAQLYAVIRKLAACGYFTHAVIITPRRLGAPTDRERIWFFGISQRLVPKGVEAVHIAAKLEQVARTMYSGHSVMDYSSFLLSGDHPLLQIEAQRCVSAVESRKRRMRSPMVSRDSSKKWHERASAVRRKTGVVISHYRAALDVTHPTYKSLPPRERLLLDEKGFGYPDKDARIASVTQSNISTHPGVWPCITPKGKYYLGHEMRLTVGQELLGVMGLWVCPAVLQWARSGPAQSTA
jgi:site-specific DNA-cytosine methylase